MGWETGCEWLAAKQGVVAILVQLLMLAADAAAVGVVVVEEGV